MFLQGCFFIFCFFLIPAVYLEAQDLERAASTKNPLVLQWEVSHSRNTDQISLIFRQDIVELVTNTSSYQKDKPVRLGWFQSPMDYELEDMRGRIRMFYGQLRRTIPLSELIQDLRFQARVIPHTPIVRINEVDNEEGNKEDSKEEIQPGHPYFESLSNIIYHAWEREWICVECAEYRQKGSSIVRTVKKLKPAFKEGAVSPEEGQNPWEITIQTFPKELLDCFPKGENIMECVDPEFGIFDL